MVNNISTLIQNSGIALLTIYIPIGIYIFSGNNSVLDKKIIVKHVVRGEIMFLGVVLIFLPLFFLTLDSSILIKIIIYILIFSGFVLLTWRLLSCYKWIIKDNKQDIRLEFISKKDLDKPTLFESWKHVWNIEDLNIKEESDFFNKFIKVIDSYLPKNTITDLDVVLKLLDYFNSNIEKRNLSYIMNNEDNFKIILEWHMLVWERSYHYLTLEEVVSNLWFKYSEVLRIINSIINKLTKKILFNSFSYFFFQTLEDHITKYKELEKIKKNKRYLYLENFNILTILFENIENSSSPYVIWDYFPTQWKVTKNNYNNNQFTKIVFDRYLSWAKERIYENKENIYDKELDNTTYNLFPEVDPSVFSDIIFFLIKPWSNNRIKDFLETDKFFGHTGRIYSAFIEDEKEFETNHADYHQQTINQTIELVCTIFTSKIFLKIDEFISETEKLEGLYDKNENLESKRKNLLTIFKKIKEYLDQKDFKKEN